METDEGLCTWAEEALIEDTINMDDMIVIDDDGDQNFEELSGDVDPGGKKVFATYLTGNRYVSSFMSFFLPGYWIVLLDRTVKDETELNGQIITGNRFTMSYTLPTSHGKQTDLRMTRTEALKMVTNTFPIPNTSQ